MNKETLITLKAEAENTCRVLYDQLETAKAQIAQTEVELERSRGDFRTYSKLIDEWEDPIAEAQIASKPQTKKETPNV